MKLSKKCEYAIKTLMELALSDAESVRNLRDISTQTDVPIKFLEQIMMDLKRADWVISTRGKHGGYVLNIDPKELTLGTVMNWMEGAKGANTTLNEQSFEGAYSGLYECLQNLQDEYFEKLNEITLWQLCEKSRVMAEKLSKDVMYYI